MLILGHPNSHTTAKYFAKLGGDFVAEPGHRLLSTTKSDLTLTIDPGPMRWPVGLEDTLSVTAAYLIDVHRGISDRLPWLPFFDILFVAQRDYVEVIRQAAGHDRVDWLPLAADSETHTKTGLERTIDLGFVGKLGGKGSWRRHVLTYVLGTFASNDWERRYTPSEMSRVYGASRVVINASINGDLNMRVFEAMAAGALLVTDRIDNGLELLFEEGVDYLGYSTPSEAVAQIRTALSDEALRLRIATAGQTAVLKHHTYAHRLQHIRQASERLGASRPAPIRSWGRRARAEAYARLHESRRDVRGVFSTMVHQRIVIPMIPYAVRTVARLVNRYMPLTSGARALRQER